MTSSFESTPKTYLPIQHIPSHTHLCALCFPLPLFFPSLLPPLTFLFSSSPPPLPPPISLSQKLKYKFCPQKLCLIISSNIRQHRHVGRFFKTKTVFTMYCVYVCVLSQYHTALIDNHEDADGKLFRKAGNMLPDY